MCVLHEGGRRAHAHIGISLCGTKRGVIWFGGRDQVFLI